MSYIKMRWVASLTVGMLATACFGMALTADAANLTVPNSFNAGTTIKASEVNANFSTITSNMPAVKQVQTGIWVTIPATASQLGSITFTAPGNGFVLIFANGSYYLDTNLTSSYVCVDLSDASAYVGGCTPMSGSDTAIRSYLPATFPDTTGISFPYSMIKSIAVTGGQSYTYYLNGVATGFTSAYLFQANMTALFIPNALQ